jgi:hypothetical protein
MRLLRSVRQTTLPGPLESTRETRRPNAEQLSFFRNTGKPRLAQEDAAKITDYLITAHRKSTEWSALEKPVAPLTESAACRKVHLLELAKGFEPPTL